MGYEAWQTFWQSGSIQDYLNYKEYEKAENDENYNQRFSNQRADNRGE